MSLLNPLKIGKLTCKNNLVLAPMAGITDTPFRLLCLEGGAGLVCAEMVSSSALKYGNERSQNMLKISAKEHPLSMQIFGGDAEALVIAAKLAEDAGADIIDINAGCPVKKVNKAGAGCVLLKDLNRLEDMVSAVVKNVKIPVTLKTRIGLTENNFLTKDIVNLAINSGASALVLHGRVASKMHNGPVNLDELSKAAELAKGKIILIVNGGITKAEEAKILLETGADGIMIGRGAIGNPFIFKQIEDFLTTGTYTEPTPQERIKKYKFLVQRNIDFYGERVGLNRSKKTSGFWINSFAGAAKIRAAFVLCQEAKKALSLLNLK